MIRLFVNGDSHTASTYCAEPTAAEILAAQHGLALENLAMPGGSNQRIIRTTIENLHRLDPRNTVIMIGWSSFERTEWFYDQEWNQVSISPIYKVNQDIEELSQGHIRSWFQNDNQECWRRQAEQHHAIWVFHRLLDQLGYHFLFYQGCRTFFFDGCPQQDMAFRLPWKDKIWVHDPYVRLLDDGTRQINSFSHRSAAQGFTHIDQHEHYGGDAHRAWAQYLDVWVRDAVNNLAKATHEC